MEGSYNHCKAVGDCKKSDEAEKGLLNNPESTASPSSIGKTVKFYKFFQCIRTKGNVKLYVSLTFNFILVVVCTVLVIHFNWSPELKNLCQREDKLRYPVCRTCDASDDSWRFVKIRTTKSGPSLCCKNESLHLGFLLKMILLERNRNITIKRDHKIPFFMNLSNRRKGGELDWEVSDQKQKGNTIYKNGNKINIVENGTYAIFMSVAIQYDRDVSRDQFTASIYRYRSAEQSIIRKTLPSYHSHQKSFKMCMLFDASTFLKGDILFIKFSDVSRIYMFHYVNYFGIFKIR